jgi:hypothetical protein
MGQGWGVLNPPPIAFRTAMEPDSERIRTDHAMTDQALGAKTGFEAKSDFEGSFALEGSSDFEDKADF